MNLDDLKGFFKYLFKQTKMSISETTNIDYAREINRPNNVVNFVNLILVVYLLYSSSKYFQETGNFGIYPLQAVIVLCLLTFVSMWKVYVDGKWKHNLRTELIEEIKRKTKTL